MNWRNLTSEQQLRDILESSRLNKQGFAIFKHSTRCSISSMVKSRLERNWVKKEDFPVYYLDLIQHRTVSNTIEQQLAVRHQSPQLIVVNSGNVVYAESHQAIDAIEAQLAV